MDGWLELESDPGLFSLLLDDFGVKGVLVEEVYDIQTNFEGPVYGFIFLFKWIEERRSRRKVTQDEENYVMDDQIVNNMFFAKQIINNSCATHALLSVLLNYNNLDLGHVLTKLKYFTKDMNPDDKGYAIGNMPDLARAHNSHSRPEPYRLPERQREGISVRTGEAFHFVSYVPINNHLFELDGLKPYPIDHGPWAETEDWTDHFRRVIADRLGIANGGGDPCDIRFNLMAVVPDKRVIYNQKLNTLKTNRRIIQETLQQKLLEEIENEREKTMNKMVKVRSSPDVKGEPMHTDQKAGGSPWSSGAATPNTSRSLLFGKPDLETEKPTMTDVIQKLESNIQTVTSQPQNAAPSVRSSARLRKKGSAYSSAFSGNAFPLSHAVSAETAGADGEEVYTKIAVKIDHEETDSDVEIMDDVDDKTHSPVFGLQNQRDISISPGAEKKQLQNVENSDVKFHISITDDKDGSVMPTTLAMTDVTKPLSIQTKFGYLPSGPGTGSSTDTASEVGSALSSPVCSTGQPSPNVFKGSPNSGTHDPRLLAIKQESPQSSLKTVIKSEKTPERRYGVPSLSESKSALSGVKAEMTSGSESGSPEQHKTRRKRFARHQGFSPKDLLQLLKNVESEIAKCEHNLKEEVEKIQKYRDDDMRRTHNYDPFIIMFLSMLAEQGKLADLVQEPLKKKSNFGSLSKKNGKKTKAKKR